MKFKFKIGDYVEVKALKYHKKPISFIDKIVNIHGEHFCNFINENVSIKKITEQEFVLRKLEQG